jgi:NADH pyrophosphatase NudC (nudix superfamily)
MKYLSGDITDHDDEVEETQWQSCDSAIAKLSFDAEKQVVEKSMSMIA